MPRRAGEEYEAFAVARRWQCRVYLLVQRMVAAKTRRGHWGESHSVKHRSQAAVYDIDIAGAKMRTISPPISSLHAQMRTIARNTM